MLIAADESSEALLDQFEQKRFSGENGFAGFIRRDQHPNDTGIKTDHGLGFPTQFPQQIHSVAFHHSALAMNLADPLMKATQTLEELLCLGTVIQRFLGRPNQLGDRAAMASDYHLASQRDLVQELIQLRLGLDRIAKPLVFHPPIIEFLERVVKTSVLNQKLV